MAKKYTAQDIKVLKPLEGVRKRPGMYIGSTDDFGVLQITKEIIDNGIDEALGKHCDRIMVDLSEGTIQVWDNGRGIPVEKHPQNPKKSTMEIIFTQLHAGGKFEEKGAYSSGARGTHGVGAAVTNALSSEFMVATKRKRSWYYQGYKYGKPTGAVQKINEDSISGILENKGTLVEFTPDSKIFGKSKLSLKDMKSMLDLASYLHPKVTFTLVLKRNDKGKVTQQIEYRQTKGVTALLTQMIKKSKSEGIGKPLVIQKPGLDIVLQWTTHDVENVNSYVCGSATKLGGTHMRGFAKALNEAIKPYKPKRGASFKPEDLRVGLQGVLNLTIAAPEFEGQTKGKLASQDALDLVYQVVQPELEAWFKKHKSLVRGLVKRAIELAAGRQQFVADRKLITALKIKKSGTSQLPAKLASSTTRNPKDRELFIVEGDSAAGTAKLARDPKFQEILALSGKITNIYKDRKQRAFLNPKIIDILKSIGFDPTSKDPILKLRVGKIILLSDPDVDGKHINVLLLSLLQRVMPELFRQGLVYIVDAPLFNAHFRGKRYFADSRKALIKKAPSGLRPEHVQRIKGWGEINAPVLQGIAFDIQTRKITKVSRLRSKRLLQFEAVVGENSQARKKLLGII